MVHDFAGGCKFASRHIPSLLQHICASHADAEDLTEDFQQRLWEQFEDLTWDEEVTAAWSEDAGSAGIQTAAGETFLSAIGEPLLPQATPSSGKKGREGRSSRSRGRKKEKRSSHKKNHAVKNDKKKRDRSDSKGQKRRKKPRKETEPSSRSGSEDVVDGSAEPGEESVQPGIWPESVHQYFEAYCELPGVGHSERAAALTDAHDNAFKEFGEVRDMIGRLRLAVGPALCWPWSLALGPLKKPSLKGAFPHLAGAALKKSQGPK